MESLIMSNWREMLEDIGGGLGDVVYEMLGKLPKYAHILKWEGRSSSTVPGKDSCIVKLYESDHLPGLYPVTSKELIEMEKDEMGVSSIEELVWSEKYHPKLFKLGNIKGGCHWSNKLTEIVVEVV